jgi:pimeloyl-ACP methyl ester carboxylesterase
MNPLDHSRYLDLNDGRRLAYNRIRGRQPGVVFLTGYRSDMAGSKAMALEELCVRRGNQFLRFDYSGHGLSSGEFTDGTIGSWTRDAIDAVDALTEGPQILVGSSMGGWIMLLLAQARPVKVAGLVGIAAAPDFVVEFERGLSEQQEDTLNREGILNLSNEYGPEPTPFTKALLTDAREHLLLDKKLSLHCPLRLVQGMRDPDVPWRTALTILAAIDANDASVELIKDGEHRLSRDQDIARIVRTVSELLNDLELEPAP